MFKWFRKHIRIRKIGIPGIIEVEFPPSTDDSLDRPTSAKERVHNHDIAADNSLASPRQPAAYVIPSSDFRPPRTLKTTILLDGRWSGQHGDIWEFRSELELQNNMVEGRIRWTLIECLRLCELGQRGSARLDTNGSRGLLNDNGLL